MELEHTQGTRRIGVSQSLVPRDTNGANSVLLKGETLIGVSRQFHREEVEGSSVLFREELLPCARVLGSCCFFSVRV